MSSFIPIDEKGLSRVNLAQRVVQLMTVASFMVMLTFPGGISLFGSPTVMKNDLCSMSKHGKKMSIQEKIIMNFSLAIPFWIQHAVMARMWFKEMMQRNWTNYVFYERIIFNLCSCFTMLIMFFGHQTDDTVLFTVQLPFAYYVWYVLYASGVALTMWSALDMGENDLFAEGLVRDFRKKKGSKFPAWVDIETKSILRSSCRHPLYFSIFIYNLFGPTTYTVTRVCHIATMFAFNYTGAKMEERKLMKFPGYTDYMKEVPNQFIPDIRVWFRGTKTEEKKKN